MACMYFMYVDEGGDSGSANSPTDYYVLSAIVVHESNWHAMLDRLISYRKRARAKFGLLLSDEIHAGRMLTRPGQNLASRISKNDRLTIVRGLLDTLARMPFISVINVRVDKRGKPANYDAFGKAWEALLQRFENTLGNRNFPGGHQELGVIFSDQTDEKKLRQIYRRMRVFNPVPNNAQYGTGYRQLPLGRVVEDPNMRNSALSYFVQAADACAFALYQWYAPSSYVRRKGAKNYFLRLQPVLCTVASNTNPQGVVRL